METIQQEPNGLEESIFLIDDWKVDPLAGRIERADQEVRLEPQVMTVLTILASRAGEVITREELEAQAWAGKVVGYDALASSIIKLRKALEDNARQPRYIETVSKKGYRLIAKVTAYSDEYAKKSPPLKNKLKINNILPALLILTVITAGWIVLTVDKDDPVISSNNDPAVKKTLMVLPFSSIDGETSDEYFADGITDDIITELSGLSGIVVLSSTATYRYKGQQLDLKKIANETNVNYFVQGSVRKSGSKWRINVKLTNAYNDINLWANRFENSETELFSAQDEITRGIVNALSIQLNTQEKEHLQRSTTTNFAAYDLFLQGQKLFKERTQDANKSAQTNYRKAIQLDPDFSRAYSALAVSLVVHYWRGWTDTPGEGDPKPAVKAGATKDPEAFPVPLRRYP